jgi:hypothetical protein
MSGVSVTSGAPDLDAIVAGGQPFVDRIAQFQANKQAAEEAYSRLGIGQNAVALRDEAARLVEQAREEAAGIKNAAIADAAKTRDSVQQWKTATEAASSLARAQAESHLAAAQDKHDKAAKKLADADAYAAQIDAMRAAAKQAFVDAQAAALAKLR